MIAMEAVSYLVVVAYILSFLGLAAVHAQQTGAKTRLIGARDPAATWFYRVSLAAATFWPLVLGFWGNPVRVDPLHGALDGVAGDVIGHILCVLGALIAITAQMHFTASLRPGISAGALAPFVESGPFAISRNPVLVGQAILFFGLFLVLPGLVQGAATLLLLLAIWLRVRAEEQLLAATSGAPYLAYCARVNRWIGTRARA